MNNIQYPANIYRTFEIVEDVKRGVKVYGLVEVKRVFRFKLQRWHVDRTKQPVITKPSGKPTCSLPQAN